MGKIGLFDTLLNRPTRNYADNSDTISLRSNTSRRSRRSSFSTTQNNTALQSWQKHEEGIVPRKPSSSIRLAKSSGSLRSSRGETINEDIPPVPTLNTELLPVEDVKMRERYEAGRARLEALSSGLRDQPSQSSPSKVR